MKELRICYSLPWGAARKAGGAWVGAANTIQAQVVFPMWRREGRPCLFEVAVHSPLLRVSVILPKGKGHFLRGLGEQ